MDRTTPEEKAPAVVGAWVDCAVCRSMMAAECRFYHHTDAAGGMAPLLRRLVYFAPCHQREQNIGRPYQDLLPSINGNQVKVVDGPHDCCGMGGIMGYKSGFHDHSILLGAPAMATIDALAPDAVVTDCLSCRLQFMHLADFPVLHPLEVMAAGYDDQAP